MRYEPIVLEEWTEGDECRRLVVRPSGRIDGQWKYLADTKYLTCKLGGRDCPWCFCLIPIFRRPRARK